MPNVGSVCWAMILILKLYCFQTHSMSMKLRAASGTYNVRASELERNCKTIKTVHCVVQFLDDTEAAFEIDVGSSCFKVHSIIIKKYI